MIIDSYATKKFIVKGQKVLSSQILAAKGFI